jgi:acetolactate synthase I/II/III large subunit
MAEIYGRLTGRAGVCSARLGPGAINLLLGTADAMTNSTPLAPLAAQGSLRRIHKESHQVIDLVSMFAPVTQWSTRVQHPDAVPETVRKASRPRRRTSSAGGRTCGSSAAPVRGAGGRGQP